MVNWELETAPWGTTGGYIKKHMVWPSFRSSKNHKVGGDRRKVTGGRGGGGGYVCVNTLFWLSYFVLLCDKIQPYPCLS
jgi:hypothetical protein